MAIGTNKHYACLVDRTSQARLPFSSLPQGDLYINFVLCFPVTMSKQPPGFSGQNNKQVLYCVSCSDSSKLTVFDRYVNDFTKALASEVRILLAEVGKLRDERRQLQ